MAKYEKRHQIQAQTPFIYAPFIYGRVYIKYIRPPI